MAETSPALQRIAQDRIETLARSLFMVHGLAAPGGDEIGNIVSRAMAGMSLNELRHPDSITTSAIGQIDQLVLSAADAKKRPQNIYSAEAARLGQAGDGIGKGGFKGMEAMDLVRGAMSNARSRDTDTSSSASSRSDSGARYDAIGPSEWSTPQGLALTRSYALSNGMAWATKQPDLMRMGQPAIQALHDAKLKADGYDDLHSKEHLNFDNKTIVAGAEYMKRNRANYDEAAKAAAAVDNLKQLSPEERALHREAEKGLLTSKPGQSETDAKNRYLDVGDRMIERHHGDNAVKSAVERARKAHHVQRERELHAELKADHAGEHAQMKVAKAELHASSADAHATRAATHVATAQAKATQNEHLAQASTQASNGKKQAKAALGAELG